MAGEKKETIPVLLFPAPLFPLVCRPHPDGAVFLAGSGLVLNLLDPFSSFGRIVSALFRPLVLGANNLGALVLEQLGNHSLYRVRLPVFVPVSTGIALVTLMAVGWLSARHGRLYCNTLCPVGALLGLFSKVSMFRIRISPDDCGSCRQCQRDCKAGCINLEEKTVDVSRCVVCFNCLAACPGQDITLRNHWRLQVRQNLPASGRRGFLRCLAAAGLGMGSGRLDAGLLNPADPVIRSRPTTIPETRTGPISPPGSGSVARFSSLCTACHLCVSVCPSRILVPAFLDYGPSGMLQPKMAFGSGHCNYDCTACLEVCPTGASCLFQGKRSSRPRSVWPDSLKKIVWSIWTTPIAGPVPSIVPPRRWPWFIT